MFFVSFPYPDKTAAPDFWIAHTEVSAVTGAGDIAGTIDNITTQTNIDGSGTGRHNGAGIGAFPIPTLFTPRLPSFLTISHQHVRQCS